jgi:hypothetical protein
MHITFLLFGLFWQSVGYIGIWSRRKKKKSSEMSDGPRPLHSLIHSSVLWLCQETKKHVQARVFFFFSFFMFLYKLFSLSLPGLILFHRPLTHQSAYKLCSAIENLTFGLIIRHHHHIENITNTYSHTHIRTHTARTHIRHVRHIVYTHTHRQRDQTKAQPATSSDLCERV